MTISKKELRRFSKSQLVKIAKENQIEVNKKSSKNVLVDIIFKNKQVRNKLTAPNKREPTAAQKAARERFVKQAKERALKKTTATKEDIDSAYPEAPKPLSNQEQKNIVIAKKLEGLTPKPTASDQQEQPKVLKPVEPVEVAKAIEASVPTLKVATDKKIVEQEKSTAPVATLNDKRDEVVSKELYTTTYKSKDTILSQAMKNAQLLKRHRFNNTTAPSADITNMERIKNNLKHNAKARQTAAREEINSRMKSTDYYDRQIINGQTQETKRRFEEALLKQAHKDDLGFAENVNEVDSVLQIEEDNPISQLAQLLIERRKERELGTPEQPQEQQEEQKEEPTPEQSKADFYTEQLKTFTVADLNEIIRRTRERKPANVRTKAAIIEYMVNNIEKFENTILLFKRMKEREQGVNQEREQTKLPTEDQPPLGQDIDTISGAVQSLNQLFQ